MARGGDDDDAGWKRRTLLMLGDARWGSRDSAKHKASYGVTGCSLDTRQTSFIGCYFLRDSSGCNVQVRSRCAQPLNCDLHLATITFQGLQCRTRNIEFYQLFKKLHLSMFFVSSGCAPLINSRPLFGPSTKNFLTIVAADPLEGNFACTQHGRNTHALFFSGCYCSRPPRLIDETQDHPLERLSSNTKNSPKRPNAV